MEIVLKRAAKQKVAEQQNDANRKEINGPNEY